MKSTGYLLLLILIIIPGGCKESAEKVIDINGNYKLVADSIQSLGVNDFSVYITQRGEIVNGFWRNGNSDIQCIFLAGLWIGMENNGMAQGNIVSTKAMVKSNYTSNWEGKPLGVFSLNTGNSYSAENWPVNLGAPIDNSGLPKIYGDGMCWTSLQSDTTLKNYLFMSQPVPGLRVTLAVYGYKRDDLRNVIFIKYGITNLSAENWNNVFAGFYSDTDLDDALIDQTGYDSSRSLSFTYERQTNNVAGFTFLETPKNVSIKSHRIMRKNNYINPDFGENSFTTPEQIILALKGLSNTGQLMINPVTGLATNFAFTGDPVLQTGWLDTPVDVRSMISTDSFSLSPGETTWLTVVWVVTGDSSLSASLTKFKSKIDQVRSDNSLWQFY